MDWRKPNRVLTLAVVLLMMQLACGVSTDVPPTSTPIPTELPAAEKPQPTNTSVPPSATPRSPLEPARVQDIQMVSSLEGHRDAVRAIAISPNGGRLLVGTGQNSQTGEHGVFLWDLGPGELLAESGELGSIVWDVAFTPDGEQMAAGLDDGTVRFWRGDRLEPTENFKHAGAVNSIAFSADGRLLAAGVSEPSGGMVMIWDHAEQEFLRRFWAHPYSVPSMAFSPTGQYLATGAVDRSVKVWQVSDGRLVTTLPQDGQGTSVQFSDSGDLLISGMCALSDSNLKCQRGEVWVWSVPDWKRVQVLTGPVDWVEAVAISPGGDLIAGGSRDFGVYLWRVEDGQLLRTLIGHDGSAADVGFSPDGTWLLSGSSDETVAVWGIVD